MTRGSVRLGLAALALLTASSALAQVPLPSRWMSPEGLPKPAHAVPGYSGPFVIRSIPPGPSALAPLAGAPGWRGRICLVVADNVYDAIAADLATFQQDLQSYGYAVTTYRFASGTAESLRSFLQGLYAEPASLVGAELIGDIPYVIFEMMQDWDGSGGAPPEYEDFPCDLFYMDLNGAWSDALENQDVHAGNGKYDTWSGDPNLEIWVSRLMTSPLTSLGTETAVLSNYLRKDHGFRVGQLRASYGSLIYIDDDWAYGASDDKVCADMFYPSTADVLVSDGNATTAADYKSRFTNSYEYIHTRSHGWSGGHGYYEQDYAVWNPVYSWDYQTYDPPALFYSFFVCSGCDYTAGDNLAGTAVFNDATGLLAWGSTKTGGMWDDSYLFERMAQGRSLGDSFVGWFNAACPEWSDIAPQWWYGMVLIGDGTLPSILFSDVLRNNWAVGSIEACSRHGIVQGYSDGTYRPENSVLRDQMAVYISRALAGSDEAVPAGPDIPSFADVPDTGYGADGKQPYWAYKYIEYLKANNVVNGYADGYHPTDKVNRGQMSAFVARSIVTPLGDAGLAGYTPPTTPHFTDVPTTFAYYKYVEYIADPARDITHGYGDGLYHPERICSRAMMAVYVQRAFELAM